MAQAESIEELLKQCGGVYRLVILAATRAKEVAAGSPPLIKTQKRKVSSVALEEILQGKVLYRAQEPAEGAGKKERGAKKTRKRATG